MTPPCTALSLPQPLLLPPALDSGPTLLPPPAPAAAIPFKPK